MAFLLVCVWVGRGYNVIFSHVCRLSTSYVGITIYLFCSPRMSKDILSSTIATLNRITTNVSCCKQPILADSESANQNSENNDQSEALSESHDQRPTNESRLSCMDV